MCDQSTLSSALGHFGLLFHSLFSVPVFVITLFSSLLSFPQRLIFHSFYKPSRKDFVAIKER